MTCDGHSPDQCPPSAVRRGIRSPGLAGFLALLAAAVAAPPGEAQSLPSYLRCDVSRNVLGTTSGALIGGTTGRVDRNVTPDLILIDHNRIAVLLTDEELFKQGSCPEAIAVRYIDIEGPTAVAAAFVTADSNLDLAVAQVTQLGSMVTVLFGDGSGGFPDGVTPPALADAPVTVAVEDLNRDALADLVLGTGNTVTLMFGQSGGTFGDSTALPLGNDGVVAVGVADFGGDSLPDIAAADLLGKVRIFVQEEAEPPDNPDDPPPPPVFPERYSFDLGGFPVDMAVASEGLDFDGNTEPDLAFVTTNGELLVFLGMAGGLGFAESERIDAGAGPSGLALGHFDVDGGVTDGNLDVVVSDSTADEIRFFLGDGGGGLAQSGAPRETDRGPSAVLLADLDADGQDDIITTNQTDGSISVFLSSNPPPTATSTPRNTSTASGTATSTATITATPLDTHTETATPTSRPARTSTPTITKTPGLFDVQGSCAISNGGGSSVGQLMPILIAALLGGLRWRSAANRRR